MGGIAVLFLMGLYFALTVLTVIKAKPLWAKCLVLIAALLIPTADAVYGRYKLKQMCAAEAGLKVYKVAQNVEGFMDDGSHSDYWILEHGYQFAENSPLSGKTNRYTKQHDGSVLEEKSVFPKSQFRVDSKDIGSTKDRFLVNQFTVESIRGELLATDTQIAFNGGWAEKFLAVFSDAGGGTVAWCTNAELDPVIRHREIILNTLKHSGE